MKDLLKEAIADAKAVRETALMNAKIALEEAFTPRIHSMLSAKLAEELDDEPEGEYEPEPEVAPEGGEGAPAPESAPAPEAAPEGEGSQEGEETHDEPEMESEEFEPGSEDDQEDDLDLDEIIRELEMDTDGSEDAEDPYADPAGEGTESTEDDLYEEGEGSEGSDEDQDIDINEIIRSLREGEDEGEDEEEPEEDKSAELEEAYKVIRFLRGKINEVNMVNAKLLYSNKLFRNFSLNESQKMKVIENFDRAYTLREVKLVYSTLAESFKMPSTKKVVKESFASKPSGSTKPAKTVISEGDDLAARFKKLAGLK